MIRDDHFVCFIYTYVLSEFCVIVNDTGSSTWFEFELVFHGVFALLVAAVRSVGCMMLQCDCLHHLRWHLLIHWMCVCCIMPRIMPDL